MDDAELERRIRRLETHLGLETPHQHTRVYFKEIFGYGTSNPTYVWGWRCTECASAISGNIQPTYPFPKELL